MPIVAPPPAPAPSWVAAARGAHLWDAQGRRHLDMSGAAGAVLLGHDDPHVERAAAEPGPLDGRRAAERLLAQLPAGDVRFLRTPAAAMELAVALAVRATDRQQVLAVSAPEDLAALPERLSRGDVAAVTAGPDALARPAAHLLRALTAASGALLIFDERTSGLRRGPGGLQASARVRADLSVWGAGLANGRPLAALTGDPQLLAHAPETPPPEPAALAAAAETLAKLAREPVALHLAVRGAELQAELEALIADACAQDLLRVAGDPTCIALEFVGVEGPRLRRRFTAQLAARAVHAPGPLAVGYRHEDAEVGALLDAAAVSLPLLTASAATRRAA